MPHKRRARTKNNENAGTKRRFPQRRKRPYRQMMKEPYTDPDTGLLFEAYPTENQFRYRAAQFVDEKKRAGSVKYNKDMRGILGSSRQEADGPGAVYQIDATVASSLMGSIPPQP